MPNICVSLNRLVFIVNLLVHLAEKILLLNPINARRDYHQGSQVSSFAFTDLLNKHDITISMDGKGAWRDNVFVERLWRTIKYEEVYLRAYNNVPEARLSLGRYIEGFYNAKRPHSSLDRKTPDEAYFNLLPSIQQAA
jgi:putative transposase